MITKNTIFLLRGDTISDSSVYKNEIKLNSPFSDKKQFFHDFRTVEYSNLENKQYFLISDTAEIMFSTKKAESAPRIPSQTER